MWYDTFSKFYDATLEPLYREHRRLAAEALDVQPGHRVLDLPCGTGQSFPYLAERIGAGGAVIGVDLSPGMVRQAVERARKLGAGGLRALVGDGAAIDAETIGGPVDRLHVFLGMTVFPDPDALFGHLWSLLRPGGRCVIVDVHAENPGLQGRLVCLMARADIRRKWWESLERRCAGFEKRELPQSWQHGGRIELATGLRPDDPA